MQPAAVEQAARAYAATRTIAQAAAEVGLGYWAIYRMVESGKLPSTGDGRNRRIRVEDLEPLRAKGERQQRVLQRSLHLAEAARRLGVHVKVVRRWLKAGELTEDAESPNDAQQRFVTIASVEALEVRRRSSLNGHRIDADRLIRADKAAAATGLDLDDLRALVRAGRVRSSGWHHQQEYLEREDIERLIRRQLQ